MCFTVYKLTAFWQEDYAKWQKPADKNKWTVGGWDGTVSKGTMPDALTWIWSLGPSGGRREQMPAGCPLDLHMHAVTHTQHTHMKKVKERKKKFFKHWEKFDLTKAHNSPIQKRLTHNTNYRQLIKAIKSWPFLCHKYTKYCWQSLHAPWGKSFSFFCFLYF